MQKYTKEKQLNNEGFSLVELLIAIVILSIIVVPLLHSFVTSARISAKARNTMHATAIAEDVMEDFEAYSIEEMAKQYQDAGYTAQEDADGKWIFSKQDDKSTTSGTYDVVVELDPTVRQYVNINEEKQVDIQNLAGSLNAVYTESEDASREAYQYFLQHSGKIREGMTEDQIEQLAVELAENVTKTIEITIDSSRVKLDLGSAGELETDVYLVTARSQYHCNTSLLENATYGDYPQTGNDAIIFSNEESVRKRAEELKAQADAGTVLTDGDKKLSQLANIIICMQPRYEAAIAPKIVDTVIVNNPDNVQTNVFLVKQELSTSREEEMQEFFDNWNSRKLYYGAEYILKESHPDWITSEGTAACRLRTNLLPDNHIRYTFYNLGISGHTRSGEAYRHEDQTDYQPAGSDGARVLKILSADTLTPKVQKNHIYDIRVKVYEQGMKDSGNPLITMDGTVVQ